MAGPGRLWRTVRYLKARQVLGRLVFRLARPQPDMRAAPGRRAPCGAWVEPAQRAPSLVAPTRWRLLSQEGDLEALGWDGPQVEKLWRYNQHYFDDLNALGAPARRGWHDRLVTRWVAENPPAQGTGWEPYPASLRIVNWVKWWLGGVAAEAAALHSLAVQARWLRRRLEWHLLGNHLFANAKALVFAGLFFEGDEAQEWLARGLRILERELPEQVLADGGQFERSPMYHALALEDVLDLVNVSRALGAGDAPVASLLSACEQRAPAMLHWLRCMSHPDGGIAFFNDAAHGIAPPNADLERYAAALGVTADAPAAAGATTLQPSGYVRWAAGPAVALLDVAPVGPDYLPGHAHADTLSFELSVQGRRVVVNGGTSCHAMGAQRLRERRTATHSTVQLGDQDSSEVWSGFRVGRRARSFGLRVGADAVQASHDGYAHLAGAPVHTRRWQFDDLAMTVEDQVTAAGPQAVARYRLAPGLRAVQHGAGQWHIMAGEALVARVDVQAGQAMVEASQYAPEFGRLIETQALAVQLHDGQARTRWVW